MNTIISFLKVSPKLVYLFCALALFLQIPGCYAPAAERESGEIALSYLRAHAGELGIDASKLNRRFRVHFPAGAVPKDGPSAGVTMTTAIASLLRDTKVRSDVAMTGEVTLQGRVLPIGGVKEKVLAAHRAGVRHVILPEANRIDIDDIPEDVREQVELHYAATVNDVLTVALEA